MSESQTRSHCWGLLSEFVCRNTFSYIWPQLENHRQGGVYIFGKVSSPGVQKFQNWSHKSYKGKVIGAEVYNLMRCINLSLNATPLISLERIASNLIQGNIRVKESKVIDRFLISAPVQKIS